MEAHESLESWWDWFSRIKHTLARRGALVSCAKRAFAAVDGEAKSQLVFEVEREIAEIDDYAICADRLALELGDRQAIRALRNVSQKLDRLSVQLSGLIVQYGTTVPAARWLSHDSSEPRLDSPTAKRR